MPKRGGARPKPDAHQHRPRTKHGRETHTTGRWYTVSAIQGRSAPGAGTRLLRERAARAALSPRSCLTCTCSGGSTWNGRRGRRLEPFYDVDENNKVLRPTAAGLAGRWSW